MSDERQKCDVWHCPLEMMSELFCFPSCKEDYDADNGERVEGSQQPVTTDVKRQATVTQSKAELPESA
jgi:hypothetical protein